MASYAVRNNRGIIYIDARIMRAVTPRLALGASRSTAETDRESSFFLARGSMKARRSYRMFDLRNERRANAKRCSIAFDRVSKSVREAFRNIALT